MEDSDQQVDFDERYSRFRLIPWWDQRKIAAARVLVVGAGALGNEILKNLALLGFQKIVVVDFDRVELSNLSRSVLFRKQDLGAFKADVVGAMLRTISPDIQIASLPLNVMHECGLGLFGWSDIIIAGLDNREARLWINRAAWKMNRPWIDGAIEGINGVARVFPPGQAPCYECTLGEIDWQNMQRRMSCNLLVHESQADGRVPTTPTISSIIAGVQVQEAVKLIHGLPTLAGRGYVFEGLNHTSYVVEYTEKSDCMSHYTLKDIVELPCTSDEITLHELWQRAALDLDSHDTVLEFSREIIQELVCPRCKRVVSVFSAVGTLSVEDGICPADGATMSVITVHAYTGDGPLGGMKLAELGLPRFDVFTARRDAEEMGYVIAGDKEAVLGPLTAEKDLAYGQSSA